MDWLEKAHKHASSLGPEQYHVERDTYELIDPEEYSQIINGHLAKINQRKGVIDRLKTHRDKAIAHLDKTYFENPDKLYLDHPLHDSDVLDLLDLVKDVLTTHYLYSSRLMRIWSFRVSRTCRRSCDTLKLLRGSELIPVY